MRHAFVCGASLPGRNPCANHPIPNQRWWRRDDVVQAPYRAAEW